MLVYPYRFKFKNVLGISKNDMFKVKYTNLYISFYFKGTV